MENIDIIKSTLENIRNLDNVSDYLKEIADIDKPVAKKNIEAECKTLLQVAYIIKNLCALINKHRQKVNKVKIIYDYREDKFEVVASTLTSDVKKLSHVFEEVRTTDDFFMYRIFSTEEEKSADYIASFLLENKKMIDQAFGLSKNFYTEEYGFTRNVISFYPVVKNVSPDNFTGFDTSDLFNAKYATLFSVINKNIEVILEKLFLENDLLSVATSKPKNNGFKV